MHLTGVHIMQCDEMPLCLGQAAQWPLKSFFHLIAHTWKSLQQAIVTCIIYTHALSQATCVKEGVTGQAKKVNPASSSIELTNHGVAGAQRMKISPHEMGGVVQHSDLHARLSEHALKRAGSGAGIVQI